MSMHILRNPTRRASSLFFAVIGLLLHIFSGCTSGDPLFEIRSDTNFIIPAGLNTLNILGVTTDAILPYQAQLEANGVRDEDIDRVVPIRALFTSRINPRDLEFIEVIEINIVDPTDPDLVTEVFHFDPIPFGRKTEIELIPSLPNIKSLLTTNNVQYEIELTFRQITPANIDIRVDMIYGAVPVN